MSPPLFTIEDRRIPELTALGEFDTSTGDAVGAAFGEAFSDNPTLKTGLAITPQFAGGKHFSNEEAIALGKESGIHLKGIPSDGMNEEGVQILIDRQYQKKVRAFQLDNARGGFGQGAAIFSAQMAGSLLDPLNIAASFIPIVGPARFAGLLAGNIAKRTAARVMTGVIEGAVGAAVIEPLSYGTSQILGDDYTAINSIHNIAFGAAMGAGLHAGFGTMGDAFKKFKSIDAPKPQGLGVEAAKFKPEDKATVVKAAVAAFQEDRVIQVDDIVKGIKAEKALRMEIASKFDPEAFAAMDRVSEDIKISIDEKIRLETESRRTAPEAVAASDRLKEIDAELKDPNLTQQDFYRLTSEENGLLSAIDTQSPSAQVEIQNAKAGFTKAQEDVRLQLEQQHKRLDYLTGKKGEISERIAEAYAKGTKHIDGNPDLFARVQKTREVESVAEPNSVFVNEKELVTHQEALDAAPREEHADFAIEQADVESALFEAEAKAEGWTPEQIEKVTSRANDSLRLAKEYQASAESLANCILRGGPRG